MSRAHVLPSVTSQPALSEYCLEHCPLRTPLRLVATPTDQSTRQRLSSLGLRSGATIELLRRTAGNGRIVSVAGSRVALDASTVRALTARAA